MAAPDYKVASYSTEEAQAISGVPAEVIRAWRKRGFLKAPTRTGRKHMSLGDVARLQLINEFRRMGVEVRHAAPLADHIIPQVEAEICNLALSGGEDFREPFDRRSSTTSLGRFVMYYVPPRRSRQAGYAVGR